MARQGINTGTTPNDGLGDSLLAGAIKINSNFTEIYTCIGNGTTLGIASFNQLNVSGIVTAGSLSIGATQVISAARQLQNVASLDATTTATIESAIANAPNTFTDINVSGLSTFAGITTVTGVSLFTRQLSVSGVSTFAGIATHTASLFGTQASFTGIVTAAQFTTGSSGIGINTDTISGPSIMYIDPAPVGVGTTSGIVRIRGDLYVDGTQFVVNSSTIELADLRVGIATTVGTNLLLDGGGIGIGSANIVKTITWNNAASALTSSEDWNLVPGKQYEINGTSVLSSNTLGSGVVNSSLTSLGTLGQLNVSGVSTFSGITTNTSTLFVNQLSASGVSTFNNNIVVTGISSVGIGTTNPPDSLTVLGRVQIQQDSGSNNRLIFRGQPGSLFRWNIDNNGASNDFRIFREDDATTANGAVYLGISTTGTVSATRFSGDGSLLTGITAAGSGVVVQNQGSTVGTATTINFSTNLTATFSNGVATVTATGGGTATASIDLLEVMLFS